MPTSLGPAEILVILVVALLVLGPKRLPQAGRQVGRAMAEMKRWSHSIQDEIRDVMESDGDEPAVTVERGVKTTGDPVPQAPAPLAASAPTDPTDLSDPTEPTGSTESTESTESADMPGPGQVADPPPPKLLPGPTTPSNGSTADPPRN